jgi:hypothetical protein
MALDGKGKVHATYDGIKSRCGQVKGKDRWVGPPDAEDDRCKQCIVGLAKDAREHPEPGPQPEQIEPHHATDAFADLMSRARAFSESRKAEGLPVTRDIIKRGMQISSGSATRVMAQLRLEMKEKEDT